MKNEAKFDHNLYQVETAQWHKKFVMALSLIMNFYFHQTYNLYSSFHDIMTSNDIFTETKAYLSVQKHFHQLEIYFQQLKGYSSTLCTECAIAVSRWDGLVGTL